MTCFRSPIFQGRSARVSRIMLSSSVHVALNGTQTWRWRWLVRIGEAVFPEWETGDLFAMTFTSAPAQSHAFMTIWPSVSRISHDRRRELPAEGATGLLTYYQRKGRRNSTSRK